MKKTSLRAFKVNKDGSHLIERKIEWESILEQMDSVVKPELH